MKRFTEFLKEEELEQTSETVDEQRVFAGDEAEDGKAKKPKPVFPKSVNEDGGAVGGMTAPTIPHGPDGAPGAILGPGSDCVMPTVINVNAPASRYPRGCPHHHPHRPPRPTPMLRRYLGLVAPFGRVIVMKKKKSKKSKKRIKKGGSTRKPKNPY